MKQIKRIYNLKVAKQHESLLKFMELPKKFVLPTIVDLRSKMPPIYDQGQLGSCTANALCGLIGYDKPTIHGSRLFVYYNERVLENDVSHDSGTTLADGIKCLQKYGVCQETSWPYIISKFAVRPPSSCYTEGVQHVALQVRNIKNDLNTMKTSLANGYPFVVGIQVYSSFESLYVRKTGNVPMPSPTDKYLGGHAIVCVGYDDTKKVWIMRNSWGSSWGINGYFYLPYAYLTSNLASDLWNIQQIQ
jgi:C1A family cysteine protease